MSVFIGEYVASCSLKLTNLVKISLLQNEEFQPATTILNPKARFIRQIERGQENFFLKSASAEFPDVCIHAGIDTPLVAVTCTSGTCTRHGNLDSRNVGRLDLDCKRM